MKLIFLDIDGTLVRPGENTVPSSANGAVREARKKGHKVFLCTGRNIGMAKPVYGLGFDGIIALAGAYILVDDEVIYDRPMEKKDVHGILEILHENGVFCTIEGKENTYGDEKLGDFLESDQGGNSEIERWRKALKDDLNILPMRDYKDEPIYKIVIMCDRSSQLAKAKQRYEKDYDFVIHVVKEHGNILNGELIHRSFDKGKAIRKVADHYHVSLQDTIGIGDSMNDLSMLETVGTSLCMGNSSNELKKMSDHILADINDDGLYHGFKMLNLI